MISVFSIIYILYAEDGRGIRYVGRTVQKPERRLKDHLKHKGDTYKCRWARKIGPENVRMVVIKHCKTEDSYRIEQEYIRIFKKMGFKLTNATDGGKGLVNPSAETRFKQGSSNRGKKLGPPSLERRAAISKGNKGKNTGKHKPWTPEQRAAHSVLKRGQKYAPRTPEHCAALSKSNTGKTFGSPSSEVRAKMSISSIGDRRLDEMVRTILSTIRQDVQTDLDVQDRSVLPPDQLLAGRVI
jgi:predicted GIY-YIG superfamily endonuclease